MRFKNIVIYEAFPKCDTCGHICDSIRKIDNNILCEDCAKKEIKELNKEWDEIDRKIDSGEIGTAEGQKRQSEIVLEILDLEFEY